MLVEYTNISKVPSSCNAASLSPSNEHSVGRDELYHGNFEHSPEAVDTGRCEVNDKLNFKIYSMYIMNCSSVLHCIYIKNKISNREEVNKIHQKINKTILDKIYRTMVIHTN